MFPLGQVAMVVQTFHPHHKTIICFHDRNRCHHLMNIKALYLHVESWLLLKTWGPNETNVIVYNMLEHWTANIFPLVVYSTKSLIRCYVYVLWYSEHILSPFRSNTCPAIITAFHKYYTVIFFQAPCRLCHHTGLVLLYSSCCISLLLYFYHVQHQLAKKR